MKQPIVTSLTFQDGNAEQAMQFYVELFDNGKILTVKRWGEVRQMLSLWNTLGTE